MDFFGIGPGELLLILVVVLIIFGPRKIPEIARGLGKTLYSFKKASSELTTELTSEVTKEIEAEKKSETEVKALQTQATGDTVPHVGEVEGPGANI